MAKVKRVRRKTSEKTTSLDLEHSENSYSDSSVWCCENLETQVTHHINGVLAKVFKQYPETYNLTCLNERGV